MMYVDAGRPVDLHVCLADGDCSVSLVTTARMGGAADFKVGYKQDSRAERAKKKCTPTFPNVGYKQANIYQRINEEEAGK